MIMHIMNNIIIIIIIICLLLFVIAYLFQESGARVIWTPRCIPEPTIGVLYFT